MINKSPESKRRAEQYRLYIKFAIDDIADLNTLEEIYRTIYRTSKEKTNNGTEIRNKCDMMENEKL